MRSALGPAVLFLVLLAGCASPAPRPADVPQADMEAAQAEGAGPIDLRWGAPVRVASSGPALYVNSLAEPSGAVLPDGTVVVTASGCDKGLPHIGLDQADLCRHSPTFRSRDGGATWQRLNHGDDSRLADAAQAISDTVVRSDAAGRLYYVSMTADGLLLLRSVDAGDSWHEVTMPSAPDSDRPWLAAAGDGLLALAWWSGSNLTLTTSTDAGDSWTSVADVAGLGLSMAGVRIREETREVFVPFVAQPTGSSIRLAAGRLGSSQWTVIDTGIVLPEPATLGDAKRIQSFPGLAIAPDGTMLLTWDEEGHGTVNTVARGYSIVAGSFSRDAGRTWSEPFPVGPYNSIMAWPEPLPDGSFVVGYYASDIPGDHEYVGSWRYEAVQVRSGAKGPTLLEPKAIDAEVRIAGGICTGGADECIPRGRDRSFLDVNELVLGPTGKAYAVYTAEDLSNAKASTIRVAGTLD